MRTDYSNRPNLVRVARAIAGGKHPKRTLKALEAVLTVGREEVPTPEGMTNNERFNAMLNACEDPRRMYSALLALAKSGALQELRKEWEE